VVRLTPYAVYGQWIYTVFKLIPTISVIEINICKLSSIINTYMVYGFPLISYFIITTSICTLRMDLISFYSAGEYRSVAGLRIGRPYIERMYCCASYSGPCCVMLL
jgi:hypothetical protein